jgi:hypothetical protein
LWSLFSAVYSFVRDAYFSFSPFIAMRQDLHSKVRNAHLHAFLLQSSMCP